MIGIYIIAYMLKNDFSNVGTFKQWSVRYIPKTEKCEEAMSLLWMVHIAAGTAAGC